MTVVSAIVLLFLMMDPIGNIPVFVVTLRKVESNRHTYIIVREMLIALAVLVVFLFAGQYILDILQISQASVSIAGGIIIFLIAIKMIFSGSEKIFRGKIKGEPFVVPLAIPLIAGPAAMTMLMLMMAKNPQEWYKWLAALIVAWTIAGLCLVFAGKISRFMGERGLSAIERLMGMILTTVAVEMFIGGMRQLHMISE
ncbi:putative antibiotic transporter [Anaerohalosphaera lusitana]|uniref:UPF0056 membrane protein n=1 Tax=Anaerohalosphaera lusitana TaxID=1936003 RepID=A0A1U9NHG9_9BACT|nr:MarC family protein [Anaerohalosphaera lusitana]AQT66956.1 putative antibiotic transporter [Anaerohalosphaera lusitana]